MNQIDELGSILKRLRLSGIFESLEVRTRQAVDGNIAHQEFLFRLLLDECERRDAAHLINRIRKAQFETQKTLEDFDFSFNAKIPKSKVVDLATCIFIQRKENAIFIGSTGVGKSHVAQAIGHRACRAGHDVMFVAANDLFKKLRSARADSSYDRELAKLKKPSLLIIDDLGLRPLTHDEPGDLYELIRQRYESGSILITTNRDESELALLFGDPLLASASMDRLLHNAHVVEFDGNSYRNPPQGRHRAGRQKPTTSPNA